VREDAATLTNDIANLRQSRAPGRAPNASQLISITPSDAVEKQGVDGGGVVQRPIQERRARCQPPDVASMRQAPDDRPPPPELAANEGREQDEDQHPSARTRT
jgi:hypothetical protein